MHVPSLPTANTTLVVVLAPGVVAILALDGPAARHVLLRELDPDITDAWVLRRLRAAVAAYAPAHVHLLASSSLDLRDARLARVAAEVARIAERCGGTKPLPGLPVTARTPPAPPRMTPRELPPG